MSRESGSEDTARFASDIVSQSTPVLLPEELAAVAALPANSALLIVHRGPGQGSRFLLDQDITVAGRHPESNIFLDDVTVSRRHVQFEREGKTFTVSDMGSMNGTYVDGQSTESQQLITGMEVMIGKFRLTFYASEKDR
jgi:pSer/pThr/pTyr-binding forkhead associated (FHA) protein